VTADDATLRRTIHGAAFLRRRSALLRAAALFLCASEHIRSRALARGYPQEKLLVLPIGVEVPSHQPSEKREQVVLFVGRMVEKKGCMHLLRAWERVEAALPSAKLVLLGDGPLRASLERHALSRLRNVLFLGMRSHDDVRRWMRRAQIIAAPSIVAYNGDTEGLPTVLCEAQALGLPVVAFHGPGVEEAVAADETALLVPQRDEPALAEAIVGLLSNEELCATLAEAGRKRAARLFDLRKQTALLEDRYDEILSRYSRCNRSG
jgi:glycosyltransferase involved in cell wall biosynthesis